MSTKKLSVINNYCIGTPSCITVGTSHPGSTRSPFISDLLTRDCKKQ